MIAERAGVSAATVSMVINEKGHTSEETRNRIRGIGSSPKSGVKCSSRW
ncbi:MAG: LacI family DNA-binding transcriptional regulator [Limnochordia bacterium]